jgi:exoribonuclease R
MYKFITNDNVSYEIINTNTFETVKLDITPTKLFNNDIFNVPNIIVQSTIRQNKYIAGILILNKTYGKEGKKFLYLCQPDDKRLPLFLIPYVIPVSFNKSLNNLYITFEFTNWNHKYPYGIITQNLGPVNDISNFYEYMMYSKKLNVSIHEFTKQTNDIINKNTNNINDIINKYNIDIIDDSVITIDAPKSIDLDDGISIKDNIVVSLFDPS